MIIKLDCEICRTKLAPDGSCPLCDTQEEMQITIQKYESYVLGWITEEQQCDLEEFGWPSSNESSFRNEQSAYIRENLENNKPRPLDASEYDIGCSCSICMGEPEHDPLFRIYEPENWIDNDTRSNNPSIQTPLYKTQIISPLRTKSASAPAIKSLSRNYLAFDIEIAKTIPDGLDSWDSYRPFGITCAATIASDGTSKTWHGVLSDGNVAPKMSRNEVIQLVKYLESEVESGKTLLTWNGAGFDFNVLAEESTLDDICAKLAYCHVDMMFHFFCLKGFALGMEKAAKGMGLSGKLESVGGKNAANFWQEGRHQEVLDYVHQDVVTTLEICVAVEKEHIVKWTSNNGNGQVVPFSNGWLTVEKALLLPFPDTSWMKDPWARSKFTGWITG